MKEILETERLLLREFETGDAEAFYQLNADEDVMKYTGDVPFVSVTDAAQFLNTYTDYSRNGYGRWAVLLKPEFKFIGWCGLKKDQERLVDVGYRFMRQYWSKGLATEAAQASIAYGLNELQLSQIIARVAKANTASIKVLEKCGMQYWKEEWYEGLGQTLFYKIDKYTN